MSDRMGWALLQTLSIAALAVGCGGDDSNNRGDASRDAGADVQADAVSEAGSDAADSGGVDATPEPNVAGRHDHTIDVGGLDSHFIVYVGEPAAGDVTAPVVLMFHGSSQDAQTFFDESGWVAKADEEGLIVVYPDGLTYCFHEDENGDGDFDDAGERHVGTKFSSGRLGDADSRPLCSAEEIAALSAEQRQLADHPLRDDVAFTDAMLDFLADNYTIDTRRVYVTGFSNGGQMTSRLALERSERIAAGASQAGGMDGTPIPPPRTMTFVFSVGELDDRFTPMNGGNPLPLDESLMSEEALDSGLISNYLTAFQLTEDYTYDELAVGNRTVTIFTFAESTTGASNTFRFSVLGGLYHQYPNGNNYPLDAADVLWDIFSQEALPE